MTLIITSAPNSESNIRRLPDVKSMSSSADTPWCSKGGGFVGTGWVGEERSPGISDCGMGCSGLSHVAQVLVKCQRR